LVSLGNPKETRTARENTGKKNTKVIETKIGMNYIIMMERMIGTFAVCEICVFSHA